MVKLIRCKGKSLKNIRCKIKTADPSGFCRHHRNIHVTPVSYNKNDFPIYSGLGYLTSEEATISNYSKRRKKTFVISTDNMPLEKPGKGGKCGNCGNLDTLLIGSSTGGNREGVRIDWEFYCPQCKKFTFIEQYGDYY